MHLFGAGSLPTPVEPSVDGPKGRHQKAPTDEHVPDDLNNLL